jgi:hypothetical protein
MKRARRPPDCSRIIHRPEAGDLSAAPLMIRMPFSPSMLNVLVLGGRRRLEGVVQLD